MTIYDFNDPKLFEFVKTSWEDIIGKPVDSKFRGLDMEKYKSYIYNNLNSAKCDRSNQKEFYITTEYQRNSRWVRNF